MNYTIYILLFLSLLSVSTSPVLGRFLSADLHGVTIAFWRMVIASFILWIVSLFNDLKPMSSINKKRTMLAGIFLGFHFALFFSSIQKTNIAYATFLGTLAPIFTLLIELLFLKRKFNYYVIGGLMISVIGAFIISFSDFGNTTYIYTASDNLGKIMAILCSICLAVSYMIAEKVRKDEDTFSYTKLLYLSASITLLPILIYVINIFETEEYIFFSNNYYYLGLLFLGLVPTLIGHNIIYYAVKYVRPTVVSAFPLGEPVIAILLAYSLTRLGYEYFSNDIIITNDIYIGGFFSLFGLVIITLNKKINSSK